MSNERRQQEIGIEFKCSNCGETWLTREWLLSDPSIQLTGYQSNFGDLEEGLFLFSHICGTTFSFAAGLFKDLYKGPIFCDRLTSSHQCMGFCFDRDEMRICSAKCECAYVRNVLDIIRAWPKREE